MWTQARLSVPLRMLVWLLLFHSPEKNFCCSARFCDPSKVHFFLETPRFPNLPASLYYFVLRFVCADVSPGRRGYCISSHGDAPLTRFFSAGRTTRTHTKVPL
ncbi:hypothetical protein, unlikely [Trypanosoma brucei gambiense DAL972]|uniref:T. brucei spp.-specific protein n=1 Tax=Trypanosoma brucei gambiense (strain MHOM/CI/86/DAL972) TaxID=679716 RepID=C9ZUE4_TRYB9|nr:hypothetical protein, unlikely [Trypanosoma brucei gambiense DAL972]CBH13031.1 hypothetical protein, unlikely [Trypanosoma brucei gambiense DAL972]|eukprot:XP_011775309.1 hypothetical protein, unlikely [Trypanosoma brucei gambiense DAL972]